MTTMASQITSLMVAYSIAYSGTDQRKHQSSARHWPLCGEFTGTGEFPAQRASNAENVSIWWRHHGEISMDSCDMFTHIRHHTEVTWPSWRLKTPATWFLNNSLFRPTSKKTPSNFPHHRSFVWESIGKWWFPSQKASNAVNLSMPWRRIDRGLLKLYRKILNFPQLQQSIPTMHHPLSSATHISTIIHELMIDGIHLIDLCLFVCNIWYSFCAIGGAHPMHPMKFVPDCVVFLWLYG